MVKLKDIRRDIKLTKAQIREIKKPKTRAEKALWYEMLAGLGGAVAFTFAGRPDIAYLLIPAGGGAGFMIARAMNKREKAIYEKLRKKQKSKKKLRKVM